MTKYEFMYELEKLLQDVSEEERETALRYYEDYFADAGRENEQNIIAQLESPKKVAETIKRDFSLQDNREEGYFTENGFKDRMEENSSLPAEHIEIENNFQFEEKSKSQERNMGNDGQPKQGGRILLWILLAVFVLIPIGIPFAFGICGFLLGAAGVLFGLAIAVIIMSGASLISGVFCIIVGIARMTIIPMNGIITAGMGCVLFGVGVLCALFTVWYCGKVIPSIINVCISLLRRLFNRKETVV